MFKASLFIFEREYTLLNYKIESHQPADEDGLPNCRVAFGKIELSYQYVKNDSDFVSAAVSNSETVKGYIRVYKRDGFQKFIDYQFANAYVLKFQELFDSLGKTPMTTEILLGAGIVKRDTMVFENYWNKNNPYLDDDTPVTTIDKAIPQITSLKWINTDTQEEDITEIGYNESASLVAAIENDQGGIATIIIEKEDGSEFENGKTQLSFTEAIQDGMVELTPMEIKEQWDEFKTSDVDKLVAKVSHAGVTVKSRLLQINSNSSARLYFIGGAGNDVDGWNYIPRFDKIWTAVGISNFTRIDATETQAYLNNISKIPISDILYTIKNRERVANRASNEELAISEQMKSAERVAREKIIENLKDECYTDGDQLNLAGYSFGSVAIAQSALQIADDGYIVDNLILIGSPISSDSELYIELLKYKMQGKICNLIRHDIKNDLMSDPKNTMKMIEGASNMSDDNTHFDLARNDNPLTKNINEKELADKEIEKLGKLLISKGIK